MATVPGVLGPIDTADLGFTLMHEHILIANPAMRKAFPDWIDPEAHVEKATAEVLAAKERGVRTIVDLTPSTSDATSRSSPPWPNAPRCR